MKLPTYSKKEIVYLVEQSDTMTFLNRVYEIFEKELEMYTTLEARSIKFMMACKSMAITLHKSIKI